MIVALGRSDWRRLGAYAPTTPYCATPLLAKISTWGTITGHAFVAKFVARLVFADWPPGCSTAQSGRGAPMD
jgi:hypothetical protein